jgi:DNA-binding NarL/FixJ family response regulator
MNWDLASEGHMRLLIADDNPSVREVIREILQQYIEIEIVAEAADGVAAVERTIELRPDVVVMDIRMPRLNGIEATKRIKAHAPGSTVIGISTFTDLETRGQMATAGCAAFLPKEFLIDLPLILQRVAGK